MFCLSLQQIQEPSSQLEPWLAAAVASAELSPSHIPNDAPSPGPGSTLGSPLSTLARRQTLQVCRVTGLSSLIG